MGVIGLTSQSMLLNTASKDVTYFLSLSRPRIVQVNFSSAMWIAKFRATQQCDYYLPPNYLVPSNYWAVEQLYLSINLQLHDAPLKELDRRFNWCWCQKRFEEDMNRAFIIHWAGKHDRLEDLEAISIQTKNQKYPLAEKESFVTNS